MAISFSYKSYAWNIGTTSFRMAEFHRKTEEQLSLLNDFWNLPENTNAAWDPETQVRYYGFLLAKGFVSGSIQDDPYKQAKTARQKTSGLTDIGIIDRNRRLTQAGLSLLKIAESKDFSSDNSFLLPKDSFIYFRQMLKMSLNICGIVRPYLVLGRLLNECEEYLTEDEFAYLLPLCINEETTSFIASRIQDYRKGKLIINDIICETVLKNYSYPDALKYFLDSENTDDDILSIGMNRDGIRHDMCYIPLYKALKEVFLQKKEKSVPDLFQAARNIRHNPGSLWRRLLFVSRTGQKYSDLNINEFSKINTEKDLKRIFFKYLHLHKIKSTLNDYKDLNRRYLQTTDTLTFSDGKVQFTPIFRTFFSTKAKDIFKDAFTESKADLTLDIPLERIHSGLKFNEKDIINAFNAEHKTVIKSISEFYETLEEKRYEQFKVLIDSRFPDKTLLDMLDKFESRKEDKAIIDMAGGEADVPTVFEYITGIVWYRISGYAGKILDYMNLSLDANLLPRTHAGGGESDIVYKYGKTDHYPEHSLLIECTLMEGTTQRRGEMEPVSRHLANYMIDYDKNAYCVFVSNNLYPSVLSDFRMRKNAPFYRNDEEYVKGMKILPLHTQELKKIILNGMTYKDLYKILHNAYLEENLEIPPVSRWYGMFIKEKIKHFK